MERFIIYAKMLDIPPEIFKFIYTVFDMHEVRGRVGQVEGVVFEVRSREANHNIPHIHAAYAEYNISVSIHDGTVLSGNLPKKQKKKAVDWISENKEYLLGKWSDLTLKKELPMLKSGLKM